MKRFYSSLLALIFISGFLTPVLAQQSDLKLEDIWASRQFAAKDLPEVRSMKNGLHFSELVGSGSSQAIVKVEFKTGNTVDTLWKASIAMPGNKTAEVMDYELSDDENSLLLRTETETIYRHSTRSNNLVFNIASKKYTEVSDKGKQQNARLSPNGKSVCFVRENNMFIKSLETMEEIQITMDGKRNEVINGAPDWVYEEEFSFDQGYQWSPDGNYIAYYRFDESQVKEFNLTYYGTLYPREEKYKYPKAGEANSNVTVHIYNVKKGNTVKADVNKEADQYIPRIKWTSDASQLCVMRMNRLQNYLELYSVEASSGKSKMFYSETNKYYIEITDDLQFLPGGKGFIWSSTADGYNHIYHYDMNGKLIRQITSGKWDVTEFYGYDDVTGNYYFQAAAKSPSSKEVYAITRNGKMREISTRPGTNKASFSNNFKFYFITNSGLDRPFNVSLFFWTGKQVREIETNKSVSEALSKFRMSKPEFFTFTTSESVQLNGWMIKPPGFNASKKYPVLQYMYGGPGSQTVKDEWAGANYMWFQMLAQKGYIVVSVDNRGTGCRGEEFNKCIYKQLGHLETIDQIETAKWLGKQSYVDASRIGAWGWSYGGYMTSLLMTKGADYFKAAVAVAPVTTWRYYDSIYTERYLQTPSQNQAGYDDNSPLTYASLLKGKFLLVHGTSDDNVHMQNSMDFVTALVKEKKQFDSFFYPNKAHGISGVRLHLYQKMTDFLIENL
jgi:dipeptidyl-peptidase-4